MFEKSKSFFTEFNKVFAEGSTKRAEAVSKYIDNTAFTKFIVREINEIIGATKIENSNNKVDWQKEYYRIDAIGYVSRRNELKEKISGFKGQRWDLKIAVEHENDPIEWMDEVVKLAHICCPLRVVIGYVPMKNRESEDVIRLNYVSETLKELECKENLKNGEFMIILGNSSTGGREENYFNYKAYILNTETFLFEKLE